MRASLIVVAYNSRTYLPACLDSLMADLGPADELIVVDNGSADGSADLVASAYPQARLIRAGNTGYAGGNNRGAIEAGGDYLVFLNPDTVLMPGALAALLAPLEADSAVGLTTPCIVMMQKPETINACGNTVHYTGLTYCRGAGRARSHYPRSEAVDAVSGAAFAIRRELFVAVGGFDERFFMYVEDTDLSLRARLAGYSCWYAADAVVLHDYRLTYTPVKAFYLDRNRHLMLLKNFSPTTYRRLLPGLLLGELVTWGFTLLRGPRFWGVKPRVYAWLWREGRRVRPPAARQASAAERAMLAGMTYYLEFGQLAGRRLSALAAAVLHPAFKAARSLVAGGAR